MTFQHILKEQSSVYDSLMSVVMNLIITLTPSTTSLNFQYDNFKFLKVLSDWY